MITSEKQKQLQCRLDSLSVKKSDFKESFILSSGKGGQAQNKRSSSVDLLHRYNFNANEPTKSQIQLNNIFTQLSNQKLIIAKTKKVLSN